MLYKNVMVTAIVKRSNSRGLLYWTDHDNTGDDFECENMQKVGSECIHTR